VLLQVREEIYKALREGGIDEQVRDPTVEIGVCGVVGGGGEDLERR
jgi:hypothetical protein